MKLILVCHGENVPEEVNPEKPLSEKGISDIEKIGELLKKENNFADEIYYSGKKRAEETSQILAKHILKGNRISNEEGLSPEDDIKPWADKIGNFETDVMLVGHLPFMEKLASLLIDNDENKKIIDFHQGTAAVLIKNAEGKWIVENVLQP